MRLTRLDHAIEPALRRRPASTPARPAPGTCIDAERRRREGHAQAPLPDGRRNPRLADRLARPASICRRSTRCTASASKTPSPPRPSVRLRRRKPTSPTRPPRHVQVVPAEGTDQAGRQGRTTASSLTTPTGQKLGAATDAEVHASPAAARSTADGTFTAASEPKHSGVIVTADVGGVQGHGPHAHRAAAAVDVRLQRHADRHAEPGVEEARRRTADHLDRRSLSPQGSRRRRRQGDGQSDDHPEGNAQPKLDGPDRPARLHDPSRSARREKTRSKEPSCPTWA